MNRSERLPVILLVFLFLSFALTGCLGQPDNTQASAHETNKGYEANNDGNNPSSDKKAELLKQREEQEKQRKESQGEFYVPLPPLDQDTTINTVKAKALYLTANVAGFGFNEEDVNYYAEYIRSISGESGKPADTSRMEEINKLEKALAICEATEINALVIDIKNDDGVVAWQSEIEIVNQVKSNTNAPLNDYEKLMSYLKEHDIYSIARVVAFKDPYFAGIKNEHAIQLKTGGVYKDGSGNTWVNSFDEYVWNYAVAISKEAALRGFDEIQYDYVRFPDSAAHYNPITEFPGRDGRDKDEGIEQFLKYARSELEPYHVHLSADVFGVITRSWDDKPEDIGQTWRKIANQVDYICPMIYPSHYGPGIYGYEVPDQQPYNVARFALMEGIERNAAQKEPGIIRPWFQGFTASWIKGYIEYDAKAISDQLVASMELGIDEYIIWNASNTYDPLAFFYQDRVNTSIRQSGDDVLLRTPETTLIKFLDAEKRERYSHQYLLTPISERQDDYDTFALEKKNSQLLLTNYKILRVEKSKDGAYIASVDAEYHSTQGTATMNEGKFQIILENGVYKVIKPELVWQIEQ